MSLLFRVRTKDICIKGFLCFYLLHSNEFETHLLFSLIEEKLSAIQVSQLLLLRAGRYDQIGVYYDATASAYQIMGANFSIVSGGFRQ